MEVDEPKINGDEVLVKVACSGICFTDLHGYLGLLSSSHRPNPYAGNRPPPWRPKEGEIVGHEGGGAIAEIGADVPDGLFKLGDRVCVDIFAGAQGPVPDSGINFASGVPEPWVTTRSRGHSGMYAEYVAVPWQGAVKIPTEVCDVAAASVEPWACGTRIARHSGQVAGDNVAVFGFDDYTASAMVWAKRLSPKQLVVVDALPVRREAALRFGADHVIDPTTTDPVDAVRDLVPFGPDVVYAGVDEWLEPSLQNIEHALQTVRYQGTVALTRIYSNRAFAHVDSWNLWSREPTIKTFGSFWCDEMWRGGKERGDWLLTVDAMAQGWIRPQDYAPKVIPFEELKTSDDVDRAFRAQTQERRKVVFAIGSDDPYGVSSSTAT
jgi:(R,R)-butanediol dehydrogenase/meso-butanediol dehydrogenase/diacetyl reductase